MGDGFYRSKDPTNSIKVLKDYIQYTKNNTIIEQQTQSTASPLVYTNMLQEVFTIVLLKLNFQQCCWIVLFFQLYNKCSCLNHIAYTELLKSVNICEIYSWTHMDTFEATAHENWTERNNVVIKFHNSQLTRQYNYTAYPNLKSPRQLSAIGQLYANFSHQSKLKSAVGLTAMESLWPLGQSVNKNKRSHVSW